MFNGNVIYIWKMMRLPSQTQYHDKRRSGEIDCGRSISPAYPYKQGTGVTSLTGIPEQLLKISSTEKSSGHTAHNQRTTDLENSQNF